MEGETPSDEMRHFTQFHPEENRVAQQQQDDGQLNMAKLRRLLAKKVKGPGVDGGKFPPQTVICANYEKP